VAYVVDHEARRFLHGGDSKPADAFSDVGQRYDVDLSVLAYGTEGMMPDWETHRCEDSKWMKW
jgi:L-ascorbate 6-phosphate lactonase